MEKEYINNLIDKYENHIKEYEDDLIFAINSGEKNTIHAKIYMCKKFILDLEQML